MIFLKLSIVGDSLVSALRLFHSATATKYGSFWQRVVCGVS